MNKKYRLNYDWLDYKKGYVFVSDFVGSIRYITPGNRPSFLLRNEVDLSVLSGALTEITDEKPQLPEKIMPTEANTHPMLINGMSPTDFKVNAIIDYLKAKEEGK